MQERKARLKILEQSEIDDLYALPVYTYEDRKHYFALNHDEELIIKPMRTLASKVYFILQLGFFRTKNMFFSFTQDEVYNDIQHILKYTLSETKALKNLQVSKPTRLSQQRVILNLHGFDVCTEPVKNTLNEKAIFLAQVCSKPIYVFKELHNYLENKNIVLPGYTTLQDIVGKALAFERKRLEALIQKHITPEGEESLKKLLNNENGLYEITVLKKEPKDFSYKEITLEIKKGKQIVSLYHFTQKFLPKLGISNENIKYYASLIDFYTVYKLQRMRCWIVYVYILCFINNRYQRINDNLINCFISYVHKYINEANEAAKIRVYELKTEGNQNLKEASKILSLFTDENCSDDTPFSLIREKAFEILERDKLSLLARYISNTGFNQTEFEWDHYQKISAKYKKNLRRLFLSINFENQSQSDPVMDAVAFLKKVFKQGKTLLFYDFNDIPKDFIPIRLRKYIYETSKSKKSIIPEKYEFLVYMMLRNRVEAGDIFLVDSLKFRSFEDDLISQNEWDNKEKLINELEIKTLSTPIESQLSELEQELEGKIKKVNQRIAQGENLGVKLIGQGENQRWTLPYVKEDESINNPFYRSLSQISVNDVLWYANEKFHFMDSFNHVLGRYTKGTIDHTAISATIIAYGTNIGLSKMADISDLSYQTLSTTANNYLRLETLKNANDKISNATAILPIFKHYNIDQVTHSSSDGQKFETQIHTINARHSPKYFGLNKGVSSYTLVANHIPINAKIIGANEHESHFVFDLLFNNVTDIKPSIHSTDTHGTNEVNFAILNIFGYQFAPRYKDIQSKFKKLYGFKHPSQYGNIMLKPIRKINKLLIYEEWDNIRKIIVSLAMKATTQNIIIGKLSAYARKNQTKRALWEFDNIIKSIYLLDYIDSEPLRKNVHRALNRGEAYHQLRRAVSYANFGKLKVKTELEQQIWNECSRLITNSIIYYNASLLSELLKSKEKSGEHDSVELIKMLSPVAWRHINLYGRYEFNKPNLPIDMTQIVDGLMNLDLKQEIIQSDL